MASENKGQSGFPFGGAAVALLLAIGIIVPQLELESTRPEPSHVKRDHYPYIQKVPARLWEDPFEATAADLKTGTAALRSTTQWQNIRDWVKHETDKPEVRLTILPVMVFGGPFGEYAEVRRRTRYAVISALLNSGFAADDVENIGYVELDPSHRGNAGWLPKRIPFEWFKRKSRLPVGTPTDSFLVLWMDEDAFEPNPIRKLAAIAGDLIPRDKKRLDRVRLIGPAGSDALKNMLEEIATSGTGKNGAWPSGLLPSLEIYAWGATASNDDLFQEENLKGKKIPEIFSADKNIRLLRPIPDDRRLLDRLEQELRLRGVRLGTDSIALVSESETFYGETLKTYLSGKAPGGNNAVDRTSHCARVLSEKIFNFNYLRGLDGETARSATAKEEKRDREKDAKRLVESAGLRQLDYVNRIAANIRERHDELHACDLRKGIKAIGIFGTDFYDKSLLLQALKKQMPQALFFTTDLDARMTDANQAKWSRNLVVVSGFGLELRPELQGPTAPFRDSYQTAAYFSTLLAANLHSNDLKAQSPTVSLGESISRLLEPRTYEIGRTEIFDFGPDKTKAIVPIGNDLSSPGSTTSAEADKCSLQTILDCRSLSPQPSAFILGSHGILHLSLLVLSAIGLVIATSWWARDLALVTIRAFHKWWMLVIALCLCALAGSTIWLAFAGGANAEPFRWAEGISIWPTLMLRFTAVLLMIYFFYSVWQEGEDELERVLARFFPEVDLTSSPEKHKHVPWSLYRWIEESQESVKAKHGNIDGSTIVREYLVFAGLPRRMGRVLPVTLLYLGLAMSLSFMWDFPNAPVRGENILISHYLLLVVYVVLYAVLLFCVVDAVKLFEALIKNTMEAETAYPEKTNKAFSQELGMLEGQVSRYADDWIDIQFIAARTESTARLVYYPFVILAIGLVARSQLFDNWYTPTSLALIFLIGAAYAAYSAYCLRNTAERARAKALERMTQKLVAARGDPAVSDKTLQQLELLFEDIKNERRGAFLPLSQQPFWKALLLPLTSFGGIEILQYLLLVQR